MDMFLVEFDCDWVGLERFSLLVSLVICRDF